MLFTGHPLRTPLVPYVLRTLPDPVKISPCTRDRVVPGGSPGGKERLHTPAMFLPKSKTKEEVFVVGSMEHVKFTPVVRDAMKESVTLWRFPHASIPGQSPQSDRKFFTVVPLAHQ